MVQGSQHIQVIYVGGVAYVQGDSEGLTSAMGLTSTVANSYANKWIAVHSTDSLFKSIVSAVTLAGTLAQLNPTGKLRSRPRPPSPVVPPSASRAGYPGRRSRA